MTILKEVDSLTIPSNWEEFVKVADNIVANHKGYFKTNPFALLKKDLIQSFNDILSKNNLNKNNVLSALHPILTKYSGGEYNIMMPEHLSEIEDLFVKNIDDRLVRRYKINKKALISKIEDILDEMAHDKYFTLLIPF